MKTRDSLYETVTNAILAELEQGVAPWVKPWTAPPHEPRRPRGIWARRAVRRSLPRWKARRRNGVP